MYYVDHVKQASVCSILGSTYVALSTTLHIESRPTYQLIVASSSRGYTAFMAGSVGKLHLTHTIINAACAYKYTVMYIRLRVL